MITVRQLINRSDFWDSLLRSRGLTVNSRTVDPLTKVIALTAELVLGIDVYNMAVKVEETWAFPRDEVPPESRPYLSVWHAQFSRVEDDRWRVEVDPFKPPHLLFHEHR